MANYSVKLVDHTGSPERWRQGLKKAIQDLFDQCFAATSDSVIVDWGMGAASDNLVLHFVEDVDHSYVQEKLPGAPLKEYIGGHTRTRNSISGSEFYKFTGIRGQRGQNKYTGYAKLALHESMHNLLPDWTDADMHGPEGGAGLAASPPHLPPTDKNKELVQRGFSVKNAQLQ
jgi:hypothetical protein